MFEFRLLCKGSCLCVESHVTYVPEKRLLVYEKGPPPICSPRSELFSVVLFLSATATFPIWASAVKTGGISSPPGFPCLPRCFCLTTVSRSSFKLWPPNLPGLFFTRLSILAASLRVTRLKSCDLFPLELLIFCYLSPPPGIPRPGLRTFQYLPLGLTPLHGKFDLYCSKLGGGGGEAGTETQFRDCACVLCKQATRRFPFEQDSVFASCYSIIEVRFLFSHWFLSFCYS